MGSMGRWEGSGVAAARGAALFLRVFTLLNLAGGLWRAGAYDLGLERGVRGEAGMAAMGMD